jgi:hypothetical protein
MVVTEPLASGSVLVRVIVFVPRSRTLPSRVLWDPLIRSIRRFFIERFLRSDAARLDGTRYNPYGLIEYDQDLADYLWWLTDVSRGLLPRDRQGQVAAGTYQEPAASEARPPFEQGHILT